MKHKRDSTQKLHLLPCDSNISISSGYFANDFGIAVFAPVVDLVVSEVEARGREAALHIRDLLRPL